MPATNKAIMASQKVMSRTNNGVWTSAKMTRGMPNGRTEVVRSERKVDLPSTDVLLVSLPFGVLHSPSLALGILQARLNAAGIRTKCRYFTLDYAALVGVEDYGRIASGFPRTTDLVGEWIFSHAVARKTIDRDERYLARTFAGTHLSEPLTRFVEVLMEMARTAGDFVEYAAEEIVRHGPKVVGFTTVFQQNLATIAVAARIRQLAPSLKIMLGGANCEASMGQELARAYPFIDVVVSGEADLVIVPLVQRLLAGKDLPGSDRFVQAQMVPDLNNYTSPTFEGYFGDLRRLWNRPVLNVQIPLETSRGCWWGMKNHCTFCGLNGATMQFRSRPASDALKEIVENVNRYPASRICFVDNILDYRYYDQLLPKLAELGLNLDLFYEIKSNVTKPQVKALRDAGVTHVQPGIESLSDQVLKIMKKGVLAIQNIQLLKWCTEFGIKADWNIICGFPGENPAEYEKMARLIPLLCHLQPPARCSELRLDRFSPNFTRSSELGFSNVRPYEAYHDIYEGLPPDAIANLAYFFEADSITSGKLVEYTADLTKAIDEWRRAYSNSRLTYVEFKDRMVIVDSRSMLSGHPIRVLNPLESKIFKLCDRARSASSIAQDIPDAPFSEISNVLDDFRETGVIWCDGVRHLSLAVSFTTYLQSRETIELQKAIDELLGDCHVRETVGTR
jgi:ribosomal peptide maturation radical SAM protein 1